MPKILDRIKEPNDIKKILKEEREQLASEIREFLLACFQAALSGESTQRNAKENMNVRIHSLLGWLVLLEI